MAGVSRRPDGTYRVTFYIGGQRKAVGIGKCNRRSAERVATFVDRILERRRLGEPLDGETAKWLASLDSGLVERFAKAGLVEARASETLGVFLTKWERARAHYRATTRGAWSRSTNDLLRFFGEDTPLRKIGQSEAQAFRQHLVDRGLANMTIHKRLQHVKMVFTDAVRHKLLDANPFEHVSHRAGSPSERRMYISTEDTERVIRQCPDATWRLLVVLARYAGLRTPSEPFSLRWSDVLWDEDRFVVDSPKTGPRAVPLFPRVREALAEAFETAPEGAEFIIPEDMRRRAMGPNGLRNANLRTRFYKIIKRAGLTPWPRLWHNLRASCETDLVRQYPLPAVAKWLGNTSVIAMRHYVDVTDEAFLQAARANPMVPNAAPHMQEWSHPDLHGGNQ